MVIISVLALPVFFILSRYNYNLVHILAEEITIIIAVCACMIIWNSRHLVDNNYFLYVGIALLFFAFLDLMHLLSNKNMGVLPQYGNLGPAFYIASRYVLGISLLVAPFFIYRKLNTTLMLVIYLFAVVLILLSFFYWDIFPVSYVEGVGLTPFKIISDYIICGLLLASIVLLFLNRSAFEARVFRIVVLSIVLSILTSLVFTLYTDPFGLSNLIGHLFQIASFYLIYIAFIETALTKPQEIFFRKLKQDEVDLTKNVRELNHANIALKQEIAQRKRVEMKLKERTYQLENSNKELESFSYSVSHDLRAPLRAVAGFSQIIEKDYADRLDAEGKRILGVIRSEAKKMEQLIEDMLALSRVGRREMTTSEIDMNKLTRDVCAELKATAVGRNIQVTIGSLPPVCGDAVLIRQMLINLVANALKFSGTRDEAVIELGVRREQNENVFYVKDNGVGFDMRYAHKLFGVFRRLHSDAEFDGTGVGLAIVRRIVLRHGGRIWAEGKVDGGAEFFFTLPPISDSRCPVRSGESYDFQPGGPAQAIRGNEERSEQK